MKRLRSTEERSILEGMMVCSCKKPVRLCFSSGDAVMIVILSMLSSRECRLEVFCGGLLGKFLYEVIEKQAYILCR